MEVALAHSWLAIWGSLAQIKDNGVELLMTGYVLTDLPSRAMAKNAITIAPDGFVCEVKERIRTSDQNAVQWPILEAWAQQKQWPVNGAMTLLTKGEWKDVLTAAFEGDITPRISPGFNGGMVMLGRRTSTYGKARFSEWLDWLLAASHLAGIKLPANRDA